MPPLSENLRSLGVRPGGVLVVHCAFSKVKPVEGGPEGLIRALREALGPEGTLAMPSMSDDDEQPFDPKRTPALGMGVVADAFWRQPGVLRSDSPHAFAAAGPHAALLTAPHPVSPPHGLDSPVGRAWKLGAQILLLGVGHSEDTTIHLAEDLAKVPYKVAKHCTLWRDGKRERVDYFETDHCCQNFSKMDAWLGGKQRQGRVGGAEARLCDSGDVVATALAELKKDPLVFLHPAGHPCGECAAARASLSP